MNKQRNRGRKRSPLLSSGPKKAEDRTPRPVLLHYHLFKNGGSTLDQAFRQCFGSDWKELENPDPNEALSPEAIIKTAQECPNLRVISSHTARLPIPTAGHIRFIPLLLLRHPIDRLASIYLFERKRRNSSTSPIAAVAATCNLAEFVRSILADHPEQGADTQTSWLARSGVYFSAPTKEDFKRALAIIQSLPVPGVVERMNDFLTLAEINLAPLFGQIDLASTDENCNAERPRSLLVRLREIRTSIGPELWTALLQRNQYDLALWRACRRQIRERLNQIPDWEKRSEDFKRRKTVPYKPKAFEDQQTSELPWTGERLVPTVDGDLVAEHLHRYALALAYAHGKEVLDIACGEGYGSALLAGVAKTVIGVDIDEPTVAHASTKYAARNLRFAVGQAEAIPVGEASIDLVVSFETLEHLADQASMLREIKRVLRPGGRLLLSTPDRDVYRAQLETPNQFHIRELNFEELRHLIATHFSHAVYARQKLISGSIVAPDGPSIGKWQEFSGDFSDVFPSPQKLAPYLLVLAGDTPLPAFDCSLFNWTLELNRAFRHAEKELKRAQESYRDISVQFEERTAWASSLDKELADLRSVVRQTQDDHTKAVDWARSLEADLQKARKDFAALQFQSLERTAWAKSLEQDLAIARANFDKLSAEHAERTAWAQKLAHELAAATAQSKQFQNEHAQAVSWAKSLEQDLATARANFDKLSAEHAERTAWAQALAHDLAEASAQNLRLHAEHAKAVTWAQSLEADLQKARADFAQQSALLDERSAWAQSLERDIATARAAFEKLSTEHAERTAWAQRLAAENQRIRDEHSKACEWGKSLEGDLAKARADFAAESKLAADRTAWARSADALLLKAREDLAALQGQLAERTAWAQKLAAENQRIQAEHTKACEWGKSLEGDLAKARADFAAESRLVAEHAARAQMLARQVKDLENENAGAEVALAALRKTLRLHETTIAAQSDELAETRRLLARYENSALCRFVARLITADPDTHNR